MRSMCISCPLLSDGLVATEEWHKAKPIAQTESIHPRSAWKRNSANFVLTEFYEVRIQHYA
jgi:hypothetical protein